MQTRNMERMFAPDRLVSITVTEEMFSHRTGNNISEHEFGELRFKAKDGAKAYCSTDCSQQSGTTRSEDDN